MGGVGDDGLVVVLAEDPLGQQQIEHLELLQEPAVAAESRADPGQRSLGHAAGAKAVDPVLGGPAESAGQSAEKISKLIAEIEADTIQVADEMRESSVGVREGRDDVDTMAASLEHIRSAVGEAATRAEEIFHGTDSQTRDVERMVESMDEVARVAERNAVAIDGVATTSQQQLASMTEMVASSTTLNELADQLRVVLRRFETGRPVEESER